MFRRFSISSSNWLQSNEHQLKEKDSKCIKIENLPRQPLDFVLLFDLYDVDQDMKKEVIRGIKHGAKNSDQIVIINPRKNC